MAVRRLFVLPLALAAVACASSAVEPVRDIGVNRLFANVSGVT